jgi:hypothetical protein
VRQRGLFAGGFFARGLRARVFAGAVFTGGGAVRASMPQRGHSGAGFVRS